jgi:hypothetical protein
VRILHLHADYPEDTIARALQQALQGHCYTVDGVKQIVRRLSEPACAVAPLKQEELPMPDVSPVTWPELDQFDRLLHTAAGGAA